MKLASFNSRLKKIALILCAAGCAFSLALVNIGWVMLCAVVIAEYLFIKKQFSFRLSGLEAPLLAGIFIYIVSALSGIQPSYSMARFSSEWLFIVFFICWFGLTTKDTRLFLRVFAGVTAAAAVFGLIQYWIGIDLDMVGVLHKIPSYLKWLPESVLHLLALKQGRIVSTRSHPITYAECAVFGLIFIIAFFILEKNTVKRIWWAFAGCATITAIIFSYSRGAWLGITAGIPVLLIVKKKKVIRVWYAMAAVMVIGIFMFAHPHIRERVLNLDQGSKGSNSVRVNLWKSGIDIIRDYPLTGIGPGTLKFIYKKYQRPEIIDKRIWSELHNQYLQVAVERGLIGLGVFLWLMAVMFTMTYKIWKSHIFELEGQLAAACLACLTGLAVMCLTENAFFDSEVSLIIWFILGMISVNSSLKA